MKLKRSRMSVFILVIAVMLSGCGAAAKEEKLADPYLDPMSLSMGHAHGGSGAETPAEKGIKASWSWPEGKPEAGRPAKLRLQLADGAGKPLTKLDIVHEQRLHLVAVSGDLRQFQHVHPDYIGDGSFEIGIAFPSGGPYTLFADFTPSGYGALTRSTIVEVSGEAPAPQPLKPSAQLSGEFEGMEVSLHYDHLMARMSTMMTFTFKDSRTGKPIRDLDLYLGAVGHVMIVDSTARTFLHVHPLNWGSSGPQAVFSAAFPESGIYKMWGQFKRGGRIVTVPFTIEVP
ncbi:hypothetical protein J2Z22_003832 [Paenibacillus forsythiae]|uniref:YtkA-like domain-containing protein n=1 Tax=Paenibacillus forsythiae TaxID=365616 RepID=A0ABU3HBX8_9BACL|nr:hypothetical protein [Paenibacillus forsythiae]MDT3428240.1 hypothetical protein [Paenibacillus forsythiae]